MLCPICSKESELIFKNHPSYIKNKFYDILFCKNCNTSFVDPMKLEEKLYNEIYAMGNNLAGYERYCKYANQIKMKKNPLKYLKSKEDVYYFIARCLDGINNRKSIKILEVGCGMGYLTYALIKAGYYAKGIDVSKSAIDAAIQRFGNYYYMSDALEYAQKTTEKYDVIIATEVIEHIPDVKSLLITFKALLTPSGRIILTTPNKSAFDSKALWVTDAPPIHLWWFSEESLITLSKIIEMKIKFYNMSYYKRGSYYYWKKEERLDKPVFIPKFAEDGTIKPFEKKAMNQFQLMVSNMLIKIIKISLQSIGLNSIIKSIGLLKMKLLKIRKSGKPYTQFVQLSIQSIDE